MKMFKMMTMGTLLVAGLALAACGAPAETPVAEVPEPAVLEQPTAEEMMATSDIVATLAADGRFTVLTGAIARAGLAEVLTGPGPFTLFAPTDEAFAKLAPGTLEGLTDADLTDILLNHVVAGMVSADAVMSMDGMPAPTMNPNGGVTVFVDGDAIMLGDARVTEADMMATNGIIHVIDNVLVPAMADAAMGDGAMAPSDAMADTVNMPMTATLTTP